MIERLFAIAVGFAFGYGASACLVWLWPELDKRFTGMMIASMIGVYLWFYVRASHRSRDKSRVRGSDRDRPD